MVVPSSVANITKYERVVGSLIYYADHLNYDLDTSLYGPLYEDVIDQVCFC